MKNCLPAFNWWIVPSLDNVTPSFPDSFGRKTHRRSYRCEWNNEIFLPAVNWLIVGSLEIVTPRFQFPFHFHKKLKTHANAYKMMKTFTFRNLCGGWRSCTLLSSCSGFSHIRLILFSPLIRFRNSLFLHPVFHAVVNVTQLIIENGEPLYAVDF